MRGKRREEGAFRLQIRIIPAHAGQTIGFIPATPAYADHPRACGANKLTVSPKIGGTGSSPRMRGKLGGEVITFGGVRIIPAHAGQTTLRRHPCTRAPDHPRACGANSLLVGTAVPTDGSSPRMRGKQRRRIHVALRVRIIPAHAGQTEHYTRTRPCNTDHPRACGANA